MPGVGEYTANSLSALAHNKPCIPIDGNVKRVFSRLFLNDINTLNFNTEIKYPLNAHDFRLLDRKVINRLKDTNNLFPYVRGLTYSLAKTPRSIEYDREKRNKGKSKFGFYKLFTYAINAFIEETFLFTKIFHKITLILLISFLIFSIANIIKSFTLLTFFNHLILGFMIFICTFLTIVCEYCARIYYQLKKTQRIRYEKKINF